MPRFTYVSERLKKEQGVRSFKMQAGRSCRHHLDYSTQVASIRAVEVMKSSRASLPHFRHCIRGLVEVTGMALHSIP